MSASLTPAQFARAKALFIDLVDLPADARPGAIERLEEELLVIAELRRLLMHATATLDCAPLHQAINRLAAGAGPGDILGAWTLGAEIGAGGMGKVFHAKRSDGHFRQDAAIKLLAGVPSLAALRFLARERQILASLAHPNIARLLDGGSTPGGQPYLVMEFVEGLPLLEYCRRHALDTPARLRLLREICSAVSFAHQQLVVHCDLKPGNILVTDQGRPMLLDFGISRLLEDADQMSVGPEDRIEGEAVDPQSTHRAYTPRYASPEQKAGRRVGTGTDVYSLGLVIAELLGLEWPEGSMPELGKLPEELAAIIELATRTNPEARYATVGDLAEDLRRFQAHEAVRACRPTPAYLLRKWLRRRWIPVSVTTSFLVLLGAFSWQMRQERDSAQAAERAARAVKDYMVSVFQGADPELAGRRDLPVSHFLDNGSARLSDSLADQPATRAELATILGGVYQSIGLRAKAIERFDEAIALARAQALPAALAEATQRKAYTLYDMEDFAAALPAAREALALRAAQALGSSAHLDSLRLLGLIQSYRGEVSEADTALEQALVLAVQEHGADSVELALSQLALARHGGAAGDRPAAVLAHAMAAGEIFARRLGAEHFRVADALEMRILGLAQLGRSAEAVPYAEALVTRRSALYGDASHPHSYALHVQGSVLRRAGQHLAAIPAFEASLAIHDALDGTNSVASQVPLAALALTLEESGHHAEAVRALRRHIAIQRAHPQNALEEMARLELALARNLRLAGQSDEAFALLQALLRDADVSEPGEPALATETRRELAAIHRERAEHAEAARLLDAIDDSDRGPEWHRERARLALAQGMLDRARREIDQVLALQRDIGGDDAAQTWLMRIEEANWLRASGQHPAAANLATTIQERLAPMIHPDGRWAAELQALAVSPP